MELKYSQNDYYFANDILKRIFFTDDCSILIQIYLYVYPGIKFTITQQAKTQTYDGSVHWYIYI